MVKIMYCPKCGTQNPDDAQFCQNCGITLTNLATQSYTYTEAKRPNILIIILGYILALLGGLFGILIGMYLMSKDNSSSRFHGRNILIIAVISIFLGLLLTVLGY